MHERPCEQSYGSGPAGSGYSSTNSGYSSYGLYLTDAPGNYQEVNVNIIGAKEGSDSLGWRQLNIIPGIYNLLALSNGIDTLLTNDTVPPGQISQIRLILADTGNTVEVDSVFYPLKTPSAQQSGLKINVHATLLPNIHYIVLLDFDAGKSVIETGKNTFILKPVIKSTVTQ